MSDLAVVEEYLRRSAELDPETYGRIWHREGVLEMPFHPDESARRVVGRAAIADRMGVAADVLSTLRWIDPSIRATDQPGQFVLEMTSEARRADGGVYRNRYVVIAEVKDGLIALWREYFSPTEVAEAATSTRATGPTP